MTKSSMAYRMNFQPLVLKKLVLECDISQGVLAKATGLARPTINLLINRGYIPAKCQDLKSIIEKIIEKNQAAMKWLLLRGLNVQDVWQPLGRDLRNLRPIGAGKRAHASARLRAIMPGDPLALKIEWEVEMINTEAMRHFKIFRNPFIGDIFEDKDIYMSDEHRYVEAAMLDAAKYAGFLAIIGEVQSGKSVIRRKIVIDLQREDNIRVIFPKIVDKERATDASICDAIIADISGEKAAIKLEAKARQVHRLLMNRHKQGQRHVLIIEEAHDLSKKMLKMLKRFYEFEDGYTKLLGIILMGQPELKDNLNESLNPDMREVIRRVQIAEIKGLNGHIKDYLSFKFKRIGIEIQKIFTDEAIDALSKRLTTKDGRTGKIISHAYPGLVNNYAAKAMNLACEMGEQRVTESVVMSI